MPGRPRHPSTDKTTVPKVWTGSVRTGTSRELAPAEHRGTGAAGRDIAPVEAVAAVAWMMRLVQLVLTRTRISSGKAEQFV